MENLTKVCNWFFWASLGILIIVWTAFTFIAIPMVLIALFGSDKITLIA